MSSLVKRLVVVLGMHRSGTSTITRALNVLGVGLGDRLMPSVEGNNSKGFFEDIDINALNIEMLAALDSDWDCLSPIEQNDVELLNKTGFFLRASELLLQKTTDVPVFGFKDPRVAKLIPFWVPVFAQCGFEVNYVLAIRNPMSVMKSLQKRDGFAPEKAYMLWLGHVLTSLAYTQKQKRVLIDYDLFLSSPQKNLELISERFGLSLDTDELVLFNSEFLDNGLRHTVFSVAELNQDKECPPLVYEMYQELRELSVDNKQFDGAAFYKRTSIWVSEFARIKSNLKWIDSLSAQIINLNQAISGRKAEISALIKDVLEQDQDAFKATFDAEWYLESNPDVAATGVDPYQHYIHHGVLEGRLPSTDLVEFISNTLLDNARDHKEQLDQVRAETEVKLLQVVEREHAQLIQLELAQQQIEANLLKLAEKEQEFSATLSDVQQAHVEDKSAQGIYFQEREQEHLKQLGEARQKVELHLAELVEREKAFTVQLNAIRAEHDQEKTEQSRQYSEREQIHLTQLDQARQQVETHLGELIERERAFAVQLAAINVEHDQEKSEQNRQFSEKEQAHLTQIAQARQQVEKHLGELVDREKVFTSQLNHIKQEYEQDSLEKNRQYSEREQVYLSQLGQARQQVENQLRELIEREKAFSQQLEAVQRLHEHEKLEQSRKFDEREQVHVTQLAVARQQLETQMRELIDREKSFALQMEEAKHLHGNELNEQSRQFSEREQEHLTQLKQSREQIESHLRELIEREKLFAVKLEETRGTYERENVALGREFSEREQNHLNQLAQAKGQIEAHLRELVEREKAFSLRIQDIQSMHEHDKSELDHQYNEREKAYLTQLGLARRQVETHLRELIDCEKKFTLQLKEIQKKNELDKAKSSQREQDQLRQLGLARQQVEIQLRKLNERESAFALKLESVEQKHEHEIDEQKRQSAQRDQDYIAQLSKARLQIELHLRELVDAEKSFYARLNEAKHKYEIEKAELNAEYSQREQDHIEKLCLASKRIDACLREQIDREKEYALQVDDTNQLHILEINAYKEREQVYFTQQVLNQQQIELQMRELISREQAFSSREQAFFVRLDEIQSKHEEVSASQHREFHEREQVYLSELEQVRKQLEVSLRDLLEREKLFSQQIESMRQKHEEEIVVRQAQYAEITQSLAEKQNELIGLRTTFSWRVTTPIRKLAELMGRKALVVTDERFSLPAQINRVAAPDSSSSVTEDGNGELVLSTPLNLVVDQVVVPAVEVVSVNTDENNGINTMSLSETNTAALSLEELLSYQGREFINGAYFAVLGRNPDVGGATYYLRRLDGGMSKVEILASLRGSDEGKSRELQISGLEDVINRHLRFQNMFLLGPLLRFTKGLGLKLKNITISEALEDGFDKKFYVTQYPDILSSGMDPYEHYINHGRAEGRLSREPEPVKVSNIKDSEVDAEFDEQFYITQYPDIANCGISPREHYIYHGKAEGRLSRRPELKLTKGGKEIDPTKATVLVISHEASRTGAPILSLNIAHGLQKKFNVVNMLLGDGPILNDFIDESIYVVGPKKFNGNASLATLMIEQLHEQYPIKFAIANSIESRVVLEGLARQDIPSISLIHEFASYTRPKHAFHEAILWASDTVFSTRITHENSFSEYPELASVPVHIIPQGRSTLIPQMEYELPADKEKGEAKLMKSLRPKGSPENMVVILGAGTVQYRKGVDLFIDCAAKVMLANKDIPCRFVWIGKGYDPEYDLGYSAYMADQVRRSGLEKHIFFQAETPDIEVAYKTADILLVSSRLDPLPNVAIDAMAYGMPVICFEKTTGIVDVLNDVGLAKECVAPYLDTAKMSELVLALIKSKSLRKTVGEKLIQAENKYFSMDVYVDKLVKLAETSAARLTQEDSNVKKITDANLARLDFFLPPHLKSQPASDAIKYGYVRSWQSGVGCRKLFPGFQPNIYKKHKKLAAGIDPLVHYLEAGKPQGPWNNKVINSSEVALPLRSGVRIALQLHVYYADLLSEMLTRLNANKVRPDLFISVPNKAVHEEVKEILKSYTGKVIEILVVPNRGRDIGPILTGFGKKFIKSYDIVGHLHTKKTVDLADANVGRVWYLFLLENLLGGTAKMADTILGHMTNDPTIGMVFPEDPNVVGWGGNKSFADAFVSKLKLTEVPDDLLFPVGTMFWARVEAIRPLIDLGLEWDDYPEEPLPYDGSILHALERLMPLAMPKKFSTVLTNVANVTR